VAVLEFALLKKFFPLAHLIEVDFVSDVYRNRIIINAYSLFLHSIPLPSQLGLMFFPGSAAGQKRIAAHLRFSVRRGRHDDVFCWGDGIGEERKGGGGDKCRFRSKMAW